jgi:hypothetical protein
MAGKWQNQDQNTGHFALSCDVSNMPNCLSLCTCENENTLRTASSPRVKALSFGREPNEISVSAQNYGSFYQSSLLETDTCC